METFFCLDMWHISQVALLSKEIDGLNKFIRLIFLFETWPNLKFHTALLGNMVLMMVEIEWGGLVSSTRDQTFIWSLYRPPICLSKPFIFIVLKSCMTQSLIGKSILQFRDLQSLEMEIKLRWNSFEYNTLCK